MVFRKLPSILCRTLAFLVFSIFVVQSVQADTPRWKQRKQRLKHKARLLRAALDTPSYGSGSFTLSNSSASVYWGIMDFPAVIGWDDFHSQDEWLEGSSGLVKTSGGTLQISGASGLGQSASNALDSDSGLVLYDVSVVGGQGGLLLYPMNEPGAPTSVTIDFGALDLTGLPGLDSDGTLHPFENSVTAQIDIANRSMERSFSGGQLLNPTPVPEPTTILLSAIGLAGLLARRRFTRRSVS